MTENKTLEITSFPLEMKHEEEIYDEWSLKSDNSLVFMSTNGAKRNSKPNERKKNNRQFDVLDERRHATNNHLSQCWNICAVHSAWRRTRKKQRHRIGFGWCHWKRQDKRKTKKMLRESEKKGEKWMKNVKQNQIEIFMRVVEDFLVHQQATQRWRRRSGEIFLVCT